MERINTIRGIRSGRLNPAEMINAAILPGEVAWYVTGRFYAAAEGGALLDAGYFLHLQGVES